MTSNELSLKETKESQQEKINRRVENFLIKKKLDGPCHKFHTQLKNNMLKSVCYYILNTTRDDLKMALHKLVFLNQDFQAANESHNDFKELDEIELESGMHISSNEDSFSESEDEPETHFNNDQIFSPESEKYLPAVGEEDEFSNYSTENYHDIYNETDNVKMSELDWKSIRQGMPQIDEMNEEGDDSQMDSPDTRKKIRVCKSGANLLVGSHVFDLKLSRIPNFIGEERGFIDADNFNFTSYETGKFYIRA